MQCEHIPCPAWNHNTEWDHPEPIPSRHSPKFQKFSEYRHKRNISALSALPHYDSSRKAETEEEVKQTPPNDVLECNDQSWRLFCTSWTMQSPDISKALLLLEAEETLAPDKPGWQMLAVLRSMLAICQLLEVGMLITPEHREDLNQI